MAQAFMNMWMVTRLRRAHMHRSKVQRKFIRDMSNPLELDESEFRDLYRISREMARDICIALEDDLAPRKSFGVCVQIKVLTSIRILAFGGHQRRTGQNNQLVLGQTTVSKFLRLFLRAFLEKCYCRWIAFPGFVHSRDTVANGFEEKFQLPNILGCIDCTHVAIATPSKHAESYLNHYGHGFHSINVQLICDANGKILSINARFPGGTHDQFIFDHSNIKEEMMRLYDQQIGDFHLIGDSGYALEPWMMTPIRQVQEGSQEARYTQKIRDLHNIIERVIGTVKATFRATKRERVLKYQPEVASTILTACCILYNMMKHYRVPFPDPEPDFHDQPQLQILAPENNAGGLLNVAIEKRQRLVRLC